MRHDAGVYEGGAAATGQACRHGKDTQKADHHKKTYGEILLIMISNGRTKFEEWTEESTSLSKNMESAFPAQSSPLESRGRVPDTIKGEEGEWGTLVPEVYPNSLFG
ncbi:hypothetical protein J2129_001115 [Methanofollis sp. W23]|nr:hypothetical protein [Methanofollis sp. W23]